VSAKSSSVGAVSSGARASEQNVDQRRLDLVARESPELVIAFGGAIGCGMPQVVGQMRNLIRNARYSVELIKISKLIEKLRLRTDSCPRKTISVPTPPSVMSYCRPPAIAFAANTQIMFSQSSPFHAFLHIEMWKPRRMAGCRRSPGGLHT
jgi:hypothetical protein